MGTKLDTYLILEGKFSVIRPHDPMTTAVGFSEEGDGADAEMK